MIADPLLSPGDWNTVTIGGLALPGMVRVTGARKYDWDKKTGKGAAGTTTTLKGKPAAEFEVELTLWDSTHFPIDDLIVSSISFDPEKGIPVVARDLYHPALAQLGISSSVAEEIGALEHQGGGLFKRKIKFIEYRPPPPVNASATPTQSLGDEGGAAAAEALQVTIMRDNAAALAAGVQAAYQ
jgi:hypothetical protein